MKKCHIILITIIMLILPLITVSIIWWIRGNCFFEKPDFWYGYMSFVGTVSLATVALWQNENAALMNKRMMQQQLRQKIGYFSLQENGEEFENISKYSTITTGNVINNGKLDHSFDNYAFIYLKNVGEDLIIIKSGKARVNNKYVDFPCKIDVVYKGETISFSINITDNIQSEKINFFMEFELENVAGIKYQQTIMIQCVNDNPIPQKTQGTYAINTYNTTISFSEDNNG